MAILVTGGMGYIGSHTVAELIMDRKEVIILDNLSNSEPKVLEAIEEITGVNPAFYFGDCKNEVILDLIFQENRIDSVIHFAGLKAVGESVEKPLFYYEENLMSTIALLKAMKKWECKTLVFSSSATVYGMNTQVPFSEELPLSATNPYGRTKLFIEEMLRDVCRSDSEMKVAILRYFNPVGAHESALIGEDPKGIPNNLFPYIQRVAAKVYPKLNVYGDDYPTVDGTGVRDYIHVVDLAKGHLAALSYILKHEGSAVFNLGRGEGISVLEAIKTFERINQIEVPFEIVDRREGDIATCYADVRKAQELLCWKAEKTMDDMCRDGWNYTVKH